MERLHAAMFQPHVGTVFTVAAAEGALTLDSVTEGGPAPAPGLPDPFTLQFSGDVELEQRIHQLTHSELGMLEIFLVRIGPRTYEAVFA